MGSEQQNANGNGGEEGHDDETGFASKFRFLRSKKQAAEQQKQQQELSDAENDKEEEEKVEPEQVKDQEEEPKNTDNDEKRTRTHSTTPSSLKNGSHQKPPAHRRYNAIQPVANKYLAKRWDESNQKNHLARLATSKPTIDTKAPKAYLHMQLNLKKLQVEEDRLATIERSNRILLEKMTHIMKAPSIYPSAVKPKPKAVKKPTTTPKSLNFSKRQKELMRINEENKALLQRIEAKTPHYSHLEWLEERKKNLQYLENISAFPERYTKFSRSTINLPTSTSVASSRPVSQAAGHSHSRRLTSNSQTHKSFSRLSNNSLNDNASVLKKSRTKLASTEQELPSTTKKVVLVDDPTQVFPADGVTKKQQRPSSGKPPKKSAVKGISVNSVAVAAV